MTPTPKQIAPAKHRYWLRSGPPPPERQSDEETPQPTLSTSQQHGRQLTTPTVRTTTPRKRLTPRSRAPSRRPRSSSPSSQQTSLTESTSTSSDLSSTTEQPQNTPQTAIQITEQIANLPHSFTFQQPYQKATTVVRNTQPPTTQLENTQPNIADTTSQNTTPITQPNPSQQDSTQSVNTPETIPPVLQTQQGDNSGPLSVAPQVTQAQHTHIQQENAQSESILQTTYLSETISSSILYFPLDQAHIEQYQQSTDSSITEASHISPPNRRESVTQTEEQATYVHCQWDDNGWFQPSFEQQWRPIIQSAIAQNFNQIPSIIEAYCGRWACANTEYAIKSIPFMLATPLMAILHFFIAEGDHQTVTPPSIHREGIPNAFYASSVLIYIIRILFACGVLTPLTLYTTKNRWPHIVPQLIGRFQEALSTTIFHIPTLAVQYQVIKDTVPLESLLNFLYCIIQKECKQLNDHHHHIFYSQRAQQIPTNDQQLLDNLVEQDQPLPQTIRRQVFAPRVSPSISTYTAEQLLHAFYVPDSVPTITAIHNLRYTISIPQTASSEASSYQPTTETSNRTPEQTITTHSEASEQPPSSPAYELPDIQELSLSDSEMQNHPILPQRIITPHVSIPSVNMENPPPENTNTTTPPHQQTIEHDTREVIIHEVRQLLEQ